jgi:hypothetical protein
MSHFRLARITILLAAIGLSTPALFTPAFAQAKEDAAAAKKDEVIRQEMGKLVDAKKMSDLFAAKKVSEAASAITAAEALPNLTKYEVYYLNRMKIVLGSHTQNHKMMTDALDAVLATSYLTPQEVEAFTLTLAEVSYDAKNYAKAKELLLKYKSISSTPEKADFALKRVYYFTDDMASMRPLVEKSIADAEAAGKTPDDADMRLLLSSYEKQGERKEAYVKMVEKMMKYSPTGDYWNYLLRRLQNNPGMTEPLQLDLHRLLILTQKELSDGQYLEYADLALRGAFFAEAKQVLDDGFAKGALGKDNVKVVNELRARANKGAADDAKNIEAGDAGALKAKTGLPLMKLGFAYVTMDQADKGLDLMEKGLAKGGFKNEKEAKLRLGVAYAKAGRKADATRLLEPLKGSDALGTLANYWLLYVNRPAAAPAAAAK